MESCCSRRETFVLPNQNNGSYSLVDTISNINTMLIDDCLTEIFSHLPIKDKIRIERVCKRWQDVGRKSWQNVKILDDSEELWGCDMSSDSFSFNQRTAIFKNILQRCGPYLTEIDFVNIDMNFYIMIDVGRTCRNLKQLNLTALCISRRTIEAISYALKMLHNLEYLDLSYALEEELDVSNDRIKVLPKNLKFLRIDDFDYVDYNAIHTLSCLKHLDILLSNINDEHLIMIAENCKNLEMVFLEECLNLTSKGIAPFFKLPKLMDLSIDSTNIASIPSTTPPMLEFLNCSRCKQLKENSICKLIESCDTLRELNIGHCRKIDGKKVVEAAIKATKLRTNGVALKLMLKGVQVNLDESSELPSLLQLDKGTDMDGSPDRRCSVSSVELSRMMARIQNLMYLDIED